MRKFAWTILVNFMLSLSLSFTVSIAMTVFNGQSVALQTVLAPFAYGTVIGTVVTTVIPVNRIGMKFAAWNHREPGTVLGVLCKNLVVLAIMVPIMNFFMTGLMRGFFCPGFLAAWLLPLFLAYPVGFVTALLAEPVALFVAAKVTGFDPVLGAADDVRNGAIL